MKHINYIDVTNDLKNSTLKRDRALGKFYTPDPIAHRFARELAKNIALAGKETISILDPFCGDGRLVLHLLNEYCSFNPKSLINFEISLWDYDSAALKSAIKNVRKLMNEKKIKGEIASFVGDSFRNVLAIDKQFDLIITNPPWKGLKPDKRELSHLSIEKKTIYIKELREYDKFLAKHFPYSQPTVKFAGWGTNLSRCGMELSLKLTMNMGLCGIVLPLSLLMDQVSVQLRKWILENFVILDIAYYPAELKLFEKVDQDVVTLILLKKQFQKEKTSVSLFDKNCQLKSHTTLMLNKKKLADIEYCIPVNYSGHALEMLRRWRSFPRIEDLETDAKNPLILGRELDETNYRNFISSKGSFLFVKGRMIDRFHFAEKPTEFVNNNLKLIPLSATKYRIAWRDISRRSQARRMKATIIAPNHVTGNSLHIGYFLNNDLKLLRALLVIMNSLPFEFQIRTRLGTGHISLGIVRKLHLPRICDQSVIQLLSDALSDFEQGDLNAEITMEIYAAILYGLKKSDYKKLLNEFPALPTWYKLQLLFHPAWGAAMSNNQDNLPITQEKLCDNLRKLSRPTIANHYSASLSTLDLKIAKSVPPGGNWKNIPESIPSDRLRKIRNDFKNGLGSRSTYYGRLSPDKPAYTINTYFNRPGNGCHLHYDYSGAQHRVISEREAARFQSFPDNFLFLGSHSEIHTQIGNAVPPLLGFFIAKSFQIKGQYVDLFCGAGGLGLGFKWAGWEPIVANDIDESCLATYSYNVHKNVIAGNIQDREICNNIIAEALKAKSHRPDLPLFVIGGPPCQGFSTAGNRRTMDDERNKLFYSFKEIVHRVNPAGFLFENVPGLLNMDKGKIFDLIRKELSGTAFSLTHRVLHSENYAIPQKRTRVIIIGTLLKDIKLNPHVPIASVDAVHSISGRYSKTISTFDAISDLPPVLPGKDGSDKNYVKYVENPYQKFMRGQLGVEDYIYALLNPAINKKKSA